MARQESLVLFRGGIGNLSFYRTRDDGYLVRRKGGVSGNRFKTDPAFERSRKSSAEFSAAARAGKLFRTAFHPFLHSMADSRITGRLNAAMVKVLHADTVNGHGQRKVVNGDPKLLEGFEFNKHCKLAKIFHVPFTASIDRETNSLTVNIPAFIPDQMLTIPIGATHFRLKAGGANVDFEADTYSIATSESNVLPIVEKVLEPMQLSQIVAAPSVYPLFLVFGIEFLALVNDSEETLNNSACNAMLIVKVDRGEVGKPQG